MKLRSGGRLAFAMATLALFTGLALAAVVHEPVHRFSGLEIEDPAWQLGQIAENPDKSADFADLREGWREFRAKYGEGWNVSLDRRSGAPLLVRGAGVSIYDPAEEPGSVQEIEADIRNFIRENGLITRMSEGEMVLNEASGRMAEGRWILLFDRMLNGVRVEGQRVRFYIVKGNLISFGAERWAPTPPVPAAALDADAARNKLRDYLGLGNSDAMIDDVDPELVLTTRPPAGQTGRAYDGVVGRGFTHDLVWNFSFRIEGEMETWMAKVDAVNGKVTTFYDNTKYHQVKGGVHPESNDGNGYVGNEQIDYPMPYADISIDGNNITTNDMGMYDCSPVGGTSTTTLSGQYVNISDNCGGTSESTVCENDLDLGSSGGTDCATPDGSSGGNTHAGRDNYYHLNRIKEKGRYYLPSRTWLNNQLNANVNINNNCNATWNGNVNFYTSGGGCGNTGELGGVVHHEYGHGLDSNDGGGFDNSSESYADVAAILMERQSCVGPGFRPGVNCSGYGDACLDCTGIRDHDWGARQENTPATPAVFVQNNCGGGSAPCGRAVHCESYPSSESIYDLATRDLPAMGIDPVSSWQLAEHLWYSSRLGSGGNIYNCTLPDSDGCGAGNWFMQMMVADDDDGDLSNGTPHGAAIFAAFDRHNIACGEASDPENQSTSSCPTIDAPVLTGTAGSNSASLSWDPVDGAAQYLVMRTEVGCTGYSQNIVQEVPAPTANWVDDELPNDFEFFYRVQAVGSNPACQSPVSNCAAITPQPFAGSIRLDRAEYNCGFEVTITVNDANTGSSTVDVTIFSDSESTPEMLTLNETEPGSARFTGTIQLTSDPTVNGDGLLQVVDSDSITARYTDADDGQGGAGLLRETSAVADCVGPIIFDNDEQNVTDVQATIVWFTDEEATSELTWGETTPPSNIDSTTGLTTSHSVTISGLQQCTTYFYSLRSGDEPGNVTVNDNFGTYFKFETLGDFGDGLQACSNGQISVESPTVSCDGDSLPFEVVDIDLNVDSGVADTVTIEVTSTTESGGEFLLLTETGPNTSKFQGTILTANGPAIPGDGILQMVDGDTLTGKYVDQDEGFGEPGIEFVNALADCVGTNFIEITQVDAGDEAAGVRVNTSELTTVTFEWGTTPALGNVIDSTTLSTIHTATFGPLLECGEVYFRVTATDRYGNVSVADADGAPYVLNGFQIGGAIYKDGFESNGGWTLEGEWEIGEPQGLGTSPGDPAAAFAGQQVLGHDLSGQGSVPGDYESGSNESAVSPTISTSGVTNMELKVRRWLNASPTTPAYLEASTNGGGSWNVVYVSNLGNEDSSWSFETYDLTPFVGGGLQIRFRQAPGLLGGNDAGWNIDRFVVRDADEPEFEACGGCIGIPTFDGVASAVDVDGCAGGGVTLSWNPAPGFGSGTGGSYNVYRSTTPGFTPGPGNQIASGVTDTAYSDTSAPLDVDLFYVVRAESNETCDIGPNNNGVEDQNLVYAMARDESVQPVPGGIGDSVIVDNINDAHVRISWSAAANAGQYHVYRSDDASGGFTQIGTVTGTFFDDENELGLPVNRFYTVVPADVCGNEAP